MNQKLLGSGDSNSNHLVLTLKYPQSATVGLKPDGTFESSSEELKKKKKKKKAEVLVLEILIYLVLGGTQALLVFKKRF